MLATAALGALAGGIAARMLAQKPISLQSGTLLPQPRALASFKLTDFDGRALGNAELDGHPSLLFFGYTYCPDICPTTLALARESLKQHPMAGLRFLFITVDPERDTPAALRQYLGAFGTDFTGASGSGEQLAALMRSVSAGSAEREPLTDGSYQLAHSATLYLLDKRGRLIAVFSPPLSSAGLTADLRAIERSAML